MKKLIAFVLVAIMMMSVASMALAATGVGSVTSVSASDASADANGKVSVNTTMCAVTIDENGVIVGIKFDAVQPAAAFDAAGAADVADPTPRTKEEKKEDYGMRPASPIGAEWFEQAAALEAWCIGKTVAEVLGMETYAKNDAHPCVSNEVDLVSSCTIDVGDLLKALEKAAAVAK